MCLAENIRYLRNQNNMSQESLAEKLGKKSFTTIQKWESGDSEPTFKTLKKISEIFHVDMDTLANVRLSEAKDFNYFRYQKDLSAVTTASYPLLGEVACGKPIIANQEYEVFASEEKINADAVVKAKGDSMIGARIYDGDIVFIKYTPEVENGQIAAVILEGIGSDDSEIVLKRFYRYGNDLIVLRSENPSYKDIEIRKDDHREVRVLGKAVAFQSNIL